LSRSGDSARGTREVLKIGIVYRLPIFIVPAWITEGWHMIYTSDIAFVVPPDIRHFTLHIAGIQVIEQKQTRDVVWKS
jgi:hypothetical protein